MWDRCKGVMGNINLCENVSMIVCVCGVCGSVVVNSVFL